MEMEKAENAVDTVVEIFQKRVSDYSFRKEKSDCANSNKKTVTFYDIYARKNGVWSNIASAIHNFDYGNCQNIFYFEGFVPYANYDNSYIVKKIPSILKPVFKKRFICQPNGEDVASELELIQEPNSLEKFCMRHFLKD